MDLNEFFEENKKMILISSVIYIVIMVLVIIIMFVPSKKEELEIGKYYEEDGIKAAERVLSHYVNNIAFEFMLNHETNIASTISRDFLEYNSKSETEMIKELRTEGFFNFSTTINNITKYDLRRCFGIFRNVNL